LIHLDEKELKVLEIISERPKIGLRELHRELKNEMALNTLRKVIRSLFNYGYITGYSRRGKKAEYRTTISGQRYLEEIRRGKYEIGVLGFSITDINKFHPDLDTVELMKIMTDEQIRYDLGNILGWLLKNYVKDVLEEELGEYGGIYSIISRKTGSIYFFGRVPQSVREILISFDKEDIMSLGQILTTLFIFGLAKEFYKDIKSDPVSPKLTIIFWKYDPEQKKITFDITYQEREKALFKLYTMLKKHFKEKRS